jgi:hypothetical protein
VSASAESVVARHASEIVSIDAPGGPSTSQTIMVSSLQQLLLRLPADAPPDAYKAAVMDENVLGKATTSGREWAFRQLRRFYSFDPSVLLFRALRDLWDHDPAGQPLLAMLCALGRDPVLRVSAPVIFHAEVGAVIAPSDFESAIEEAFPGAYKENTRRTTAQKVASSWAQAGHLHMEGPNRKVRVRACCAPAPVAYALMLGYLQSHRGQALFETVWARTLDRPTSQLVELAATAPQAGMLEFRHAGGVMEIEFGHLLRPFDDELGAAE